MKEALNATKKRLRVDTVVVLIIAITMLGFAANSIGNAIRFALMPRDAFEVRLISEEDGRTIDTVTVDATGTEQLSYALFVSGESYMPADYNEVNRIDAEGRMNPQPVIVTNYAVSGISQIMIAAVFSVLFLLFNSVKRGESPFTKTSVRYLRIAAVLVMLLGLLPEAIRVMANVVFYSLSYIHLDPSFLFVLAIGAVLGMISEVFRYGCALQEDMDQIA